MDKSKMILKISRAVYKTGFALKKHSPELFMILGIGTAITGTVLACIATTKIDTVLDKTKVELDAVHQKNKEAETKEMVEANRKELVSVYAKTGLGFAKLYAPAVAMTALSITSFIASNHILKSRYVGVAAAFAATSESFKKYRAGVIDRYGEDVDKELAYGIRKREITEHVVDENGEAHAVTATVDVADSDMPSPFARYFTPKNFFWDDDAMYNESFLNNQMRYANDLLRSKGYLYLNTVYDNLGLKQSKIGQVAGWRYKKGNDDGDNYVQFITKKVKIPKSSDPEDGYEDAIFIDFNVDGNIFEKLTDDEYFEA